MRLRRLRRVRLHLFDRPEIDSPRFEGLLLSRRRHEYLLGDSSLLFSPEAQPLQPEGRMVAIPRENVMWLEVMQ